MGVVRRDLLTKVGTAQVGPIDLIGARLWRSKASPSKTSALAGLHAATGTSYGIRPRFSRRTTPISIHSLAQFRGLSLPTTRTRIGAWPPALPHRALNGTPPGPCPTATCWLCCAVRSRPPPATRTARSPPTRQEALAYYDREGLGTKEEGRSQVVTSEFADVMKSIMPGLMRVFTGTDDLATFAPLAPGQEKWARGRPAAVVRCVRHHQNDGLPHRLGAPEGRPDVPPGRRRRRRRGSDGRKRRASPCRASPTTPST